MAAFKAFVHAFLAALFLFAAYYDWYVIKFPDVFHERNEQSWGRSKYLSYWNLYLQIVFYLLSFLNDVLHCTGCCQGPKKDGPGKFEAFLDLVFSSIGFPVSLIVSTSFGLIFIINREMAYPLMMDTFIPRWLTFIIQLMVLPAATVEMLMVDHRYSANRCCKQLLLFLYIILNMSWVVYIGHTCQFFAYTALEPLTIGQQLGVIVLCATIGLVPQYLGEVLHWVVWGPVKSKDKVVVPKKKSKLDKKKQR